MTMEPWQTTIEVYSDFPFCCTADKWDIDTIPCISDSADESTIVFFCEYFTYHRIADFECLGHDCPACKLAGHDEYIKRLNAGRVL